MSKAKRQMCLLMALMLAAVMPLAAQPKALVLLSDGYGANYHLLEDRMKTAGFQWVTTAVRSNVSACAAYAARLGCGSITVDSLVADIRHAEAYDVLLIVSATKWTGLPPLSATLQSDEAVSLVKKAAEGGAVMAAWCSGVRLLARAGLLTGRRVTGNDQYVQEYLDAGAVWAGANQYPITDGLIITWGRGQFYYEAAVSAMLDAVIREGE